MNTSTLTHTTFELDLSEMYQPVSIDLNQVFGAVGLRYAVALESYGVVKVHQSENNAEIALSAGAYAEAGQRTRLVVRANDGTGSSVAVVFKLSIVDRGSRRRLSA